MTREEQHAIDVTTAYLRGYANCANGKAIAWVPLGDIFPNRNVSDATRCGFIAKAGSKGELDAHGIEFDAEKFAVRLQA